MVGLLLLSSTLFLPLYHKTTHQRSLSIIPFVLQSYVTLFLHMHINKAQKT